MFYPIRSTIIRSLKIYSEKYPDKTAIICGDDSITFSELFEKVKELAEVLEGQKGKRVYIKNERKIETIIKMLATLGAFKTYRIVNDFSEIDEDENKRFDWQDSQYDYTSYYMYEIKTSGTTGGRKLIGRNQWLFRRFMDKYKTAFNIKANDVILNQLDFTFDASAKDIYSMVLTGATLCIGDREQMNFPLNFINIVKKYNVTVFQTTPFFIKNMAKLKAFENEVPDTLKTVLFVGDVMKSEYLNYWIEKMPDTLFVNQYGVSEVEGNIMYHRIRKKVESEYVPLTKCVRSVMIDEDGELCLCYFGSPPEKLGDLARYMKKGEPGYVSSGIIMLGRVDDIRKIRGYRINLGEIDRELAHITYIRDALSEIVDDEIYALCECDAEKFNEKEIRASIKKKLPSYCQPIHIKQVDNIPVNANGKRDRKKIMEFFV